MKNNYINKYVNNIDDYVLEKYLEHKCLYYTKDLNNNNQEAIWIEVDVVRHMFSKVIEINGLYIRNFEGIFIYISSIK